MNKYVTNIIRYLKSLLIMVIVFILNTFVKSHFAPNFFKTFIASASVGKGIRDYNSGQYKKAITILTPISEYDIKDISVGTSQFLLGIIYYFWLGSEKNISLTRKL